MGDNRGTDSSESGASPAKERQQQFELRQQAIAETLSCLEQAKRSQGIILGVSNYFAPRALFENVEAVVETIREYR